MWSIVGILALLLVVEGSPLDSSIRLDSANSDARIIGGVDAKEGQFPYMAAFFFDGDQFCGGCILSPWWILSAAHCFLSINNSNRDRVTVRVGSVQLKQGGQVYSVGPIYKKKFSDVSALEDIAMVKTKKPIAFSPTVQPIGLPTGDLKPGTKLTISGWGQTNTNPVETPEHLQTAVTTLISMYDCQQRYKGQGDYAIYLNDATQLCTYEKVGIGFCQGDSGGPLAHNNVTYGIVSWNTPCAEGYPDVYTKVLAYLNYIEGFLNST